MQKLEREIDQFTSIRVVSVLGFDLLEQEAKKLQYSQTEELELSISLVLEKLSKVNSRLEKEELLLDLAVLILATLQAESCILLFDSLSGKYVWSKTHTKNNYLYWDSGKNDLVTTPDAVIRIYKFENYREKWWLNVAGSFKDDQTFNEAENIGKLWRGIDTCASL